MLSKKDCITILLLCLKAFFDVFVLHFPDEVVYKIFFKSLSTRFKTLFATKELLEAVLNCRDQTPVMTPGFKRKKK